MYQRAQSNKVFKFFNDLSESKYFSAFISLAILGNTLVLALDKYPLTEEEFETQELVNQVFSVIFFFELVIKVIGLGFKGYASDLSNLFDCFIVIVSTIDMVMTYSGAESSGGGAISAMRAFRLLRIFKLAKSWKKFQDLLKTIVHTLYSIAPFTVILLIFIFIYTLLGMELFAFKVRFDDNGNPTDDGGSAPSSNFDDFLEAFTSVFIVLANDGWSTIYFEHYRACGGLISSLFFISLLLIGQFILWNLFLAILLNNFDEDSKDQEVEKEADKL